MFKYHRCRQGNVLSEAQMIHFYKDFYLLRSFPHCDIFSSTFLIKALLSYMYHHSQQLHIIKRKGEPATEIFVYSLKFEFPWGHNY